MVEKPCLKFFKRPEGRVHGAGPAPEGPTVEGDDAGRGEEAEAAEEDDHGDQDQEEGVKVVLEE